MRYYYFVLQSQEKLGWRVRKCQDDFPLYDIINENPNHLLTFWKEISEEEAKKFIEQVS